jgi:hypothetical protein
MSGSTLEQVGQAVLWKKLSLLFSATFPHNAGKSFVFFKIPAFSHALNLGPLFS